MTIAVSIPDRLFEEAEKAAKELALSRSKLVQTALESYLKTRRETKMAASIDAYVRDHGTKLTDEDEIWLAEGRKMARKNAQ